MPNTHSNLTSLFTDIANAIRGKTGSTETIVADNFPTAIADISTGAPDGHSWTRVELPITPWRDGSSEGINFDNQTCEIAYGAGKYAILVNCYNSNYSKIIYSTDLVNWTTISLNTDITSTSTDFSQKYEWLVYGNAGFVLMHDPGGEQAAYIGHTTDFADSTKWHFSKSGTSELEELEYWLNFFSTGNKYIAVGDQGTTAISMNGDAWARGYSWQGDGMYNGADGFAMFCPTTGLTGIEIMNCIGEIGSESNIDSYTFPNTPSGYMFNGIIAPFAGNGKYISMIANCQSDGDLGLYQIIVYDGATWSTANLQMASNSSLFQTVGVYGNGKYLLFTPVGTYMSKDALNWTMIASQLTTVRKAIYGNGAFVGLAIEENDTKLVIYYSRTTNDY